MSQLIITINTDGAAFEDKSEIEVARILSMLAVGLTRGTIDTDGGKLIDANGNTCGRIELEV